MQEALWLKTHSLRDRRRQMGTLWCRTSDLRLSLSPTLHDSLPDKSTPRDGRSYWYCIHPIGCHGLSVDQTSGRMVYEPSKVVHHLAHIRRPLKAMHSPNTYVSKGHLIRHFKCTLRIYNYMSFIAIF